MKQFLALLEDIYKNGKDRSDRTGVGRRGIFGTRMEFDLADGFPLVTSRFTSFKNIKEELLWFISGSYDNNALKERGINFWRAWEVSRNEVLMKADEDELNPDSSKFFYPGSIGPMYGYAWRNAPSDFKGRTYQDYIAYFEKHIGSVSDPTMIDRFAPDIQRFLLSEQHLIDSTATQTELESFIAFNRNSFTRGLNERLLERLVAYDLTGIDQLWESIKMLKSNPYSARNCVTAWIPQWVPYQDKGYARNVYEGKGVLAPCHAFFQFFVEPDENGRPATVSLMLDQRSSDTGVGAPYNVASYSLLLLMAAREVGLKPGRFVWVGGDTHIYLNQLASVEEHLGRETHELPTVTIKESANKSIFLITPEDIELHGYKHSGKLEYPVAS